MTRPLGIRRVMLLLCALLAAGALQAQTQATAIVRTPIAGTVLPGLADAPRYWKLLVVELSREAHPAPAVDGLVYVRSGILSIRSGGGTTLVHAGEGAALALGSAATLASEGKEEATFLHFLLVKADQLNAAMYPAGCAQELYRTDAPLPGLKPGPYAFNLTRVTFPAHMPPNPPHYRSGGALYFVLSGTGAFVTEGKTTRKPPETPHYEPFGMVHQWGVPGDEPLTFLAANVNPDGTPAVIPGASPH
jgi:quercetin dioxygenase-like cupin family protein